MHRNVGGGFRILFADAPGHGGGGGNAQAHRHRVEQREQRFGEADGGDGVRAQMRDPENVDHGEERFHHHLEHHGNGEQSDRARDGTFGEIAMRVAEDCVPYRGPDTGVTAWRVLVNRGGHDDYRFKGSSIHGGVASMRRPSSGSSCSIFCFISQAIWR